MPKQNSGYPLDSRSWGVVTHLRSFSYKVHVCCPLVEEMYPNRVTVVLAETGVMVDAIQGPFQCLHAKQADAAVPNCEKLGTSLSCWKRLCTAASFNSACPSCTRAEGATA